MFVKTIGDMQKCNLEILKSFDTLCKDNAVSYSLAYGNILGLIRDNGFIPWDDDIDVFMLRGEYEKLLSLPKESFDSNYELVVPEDLDYFYDFIPRYVCKKYTAERVDVFDKDHKPIIENLRIDIMIIDDSFVDQKKHRSQIRRLRKIYLQTTKYRIHVLDRPFYIRLIKWAVGLTAGRESLQSLMERYRRVSLECTEKSSVVYISNSLPNELGMQYDREWFEHPVETMLCGVRTYIPMNPEGLLKMWYGNYMEMPPEDRRKPDHFKLDLD